MNHKEISDFIIAEVNRNLEVIRYTNNESYDRFAAGRIKVLVDLLGILMNCKNAGEFRTRISMMNKSVVGATSILEEIDGMVAKG